MSQGSEEWQLRPMHAAMLDEVARLERAAYEFPWTRKMFQDCLESGYSAWVWCCQQMLGGYGLMMMGAGEAHLLNLCVDAEQRRHGLGSRMLHHLLRIARAADCERMFLEVRASNLAAQALYLREGFTRVGIRKNYYQAPTGSEDAWVMCLDWTEA